MNNFYFLGNKLDFLLQVYDVKQAVYEFVMVGAKGRGGSSPLHLACSRDTSSVGRYPICNFPSVPTIDLLLECGAPVDARDNVRKRKIIAIG